MSATTCHRLRVVLDMGGTDAARELMSSCTDLEIAARYRVARTTVYAWERLLEVKCRRQCVKCGDVHRYEDMLLNSLGQVQDGVCRKAACMQAAASVRGLHLRKPKRRDPAGEVPDEIRKLTSAALSTTDERLCYYVQPVMEETCS